MGWMWPLICSSCEAEKMWRKQCHCAYSQAMNASVVWGIRAFLQSSKHQKLARVWLGRVRRELSRNDTEGWCISSTQNGAAMFGCFERQWGDEPGK